jgi:putative transposase
MEGITMSSTHSCLYYQFIFSTKKRRRWIKEPWEGRLHAYLGGIIRKLGGIPNTIGGDSDHVHVLVRLKATHCVADVMREIKSSSSAWIHNEIGIRFFEWQDGYGAFTVSSSAVDSVKGYIEKQKEHHRRKPFQEEYLELLRESGIEFDERYLW